MVKFMGDGQAPPITGTERSSIDDLLAARNGVDRDKTELTILNRETYIAGVGSNMRNRIHEHVAHVSASLGIDLTKTPEYRRWMEGMDDFNELAHELAVRLDPWNQQRPSEEPRPFYARAGDVFYSLALNLAQLSPFR
jgi:hypothetical protein